MTNCIIGVDPGKTGGIAWRNEEGEYRVIPMPESERDIIGALRGIVFQKDRKCLAFIEKVGAMKGWGTSSSFKFGRSYGGLITALLSVDIPLEYVLPSRWQKDLKCLSGGDKKVTRTKAVELFPTVDGITHKTADALLIAYWAVNHGPKI